jgi:pimeloyl-ACP methyl ester carboxylesterase
VLESSTTWSHLHARGPCVFHEFTIAGESPPAPSNFATTPIISHGRPCSLRISTGITDLTRIPASVVQRTSRGRYRQTSDHPAITPTHTPMNPALTSPTRSTTDEQEAVECAEAKFELGNTAIFSCKADPRFCYTLYVPPIADTGESVELMVAMHGSSRDSFLDFRNGFAEFGRWNRCAVLCPLFPIGVLGDDNGNGYKYMVESEIRYDRVLQAMVDEVGAKYRQNWDTFALFGYSGGGHFAHRYAILHPEKLWAVSIGAPGSVTLLNPDKDWWVGIRDLKARFGIEFNGKVLTSVPVQMIVGNADLETWEITHKPGDRYYMEGANDAGRTRPERLESLRASFEAVGISVRFELVPGVAHDRMSVLNQVQNFLAEVLARKRASA